MPNVREQLEAELRRKHQQLAEIHVKLQLALGQCSPELECSRLQGEDQDPDSPFSITSDEDMKVSLKLEALRIAGLTSGTSPDSVADEDDFVMVSQTRSKDGSSCDAPIAV